MRLRTWELLGVAIFSAVVGSATSFWIFHSRPASAENGVTEAKIQEEADSYSIRDFNTGKVRLSIFNMGDGNGNLRPTIMFYDKNGNAKACIRLENNGRLFQGDPRDED